MMHCGYFPIIFATFTSKHEKFQETNFKISPGGGVAEGDDLGGADECEVERVEEEDDVFALVVRQADLLELT